MEPWLDNLAPDIKQTIDADKYISIPDFFDDVVKKYHNKSAFINMGSAITFSELEEESRAFASYLQNILLLKKGERVALMMPNILQYPVALLGVLRAGLIVVNVNPLYTPRELKHQLIDSGATTIIILSNVAKTLEEIINETQIKHVIVTDLGDMFGFFKSKIVNFVVRYIKKLVPKFTLKNAIQFNKVLNKGRYIEFQKADIMSNDTAFLQYTGGTTGVAKGAILTHKNIIANILQANNAFSPLLEDGKECVVTALPLYHVFALTINCFFFMYNGSTNLLITNPRDLKSYIKDLKQTPFTVMIGVNTLFNNLLNNDDFVNLDFSKLKLSIGGGMAVQSSIAQKWQSVTKTKLLEGYGLTESAPLLTCCPYNIEGYNGSIGFPVASTSMKITDDDGNSLPIGSIGEIWARGPQIMKGYWLREEETKKVINEDGWLATGDLGYMDEKGFFYIVDRKKDLIIVSGFNVYPTEIEDVVTSNPKVLEAAAIGVDNKAAGEAVKIFVVRKDETLTEQEIIEYCSKDLTRYKIPKYVEFCDSLPKSNVGKILRRELKPKN